MHEDNDRRRRRDHRHDDLEQQYMAMVERIRGYQMPEAARVGILTEIEATYRRERAAGAPAGLPQFDLDLIFFQSK